MREVNIKNVTYGKKMVNGRYEVDYGKWVDLSELPIRKEGIDWNKSVGNIVCFKYDNISGYISIEAYSSKSRIMKIKYNGIMYYIDYIILRNCNLGNILNKKTSDFKVEIGEVFKDNKRDLTIIDKKYVKNKNNNRKWYKYRCNKCNWDEGWVIEHSLVTQKTGCSCCSGHTVVEGINDIATTAPWMVKYFANPEDAKKYTYNSDKKILVTCDNCKNSKLIQISKLFARKHISCNCSDNFSYPEKFVYNLLKQINLNFKTQLNKSQMTWCDKYKYDFYISNSSVIIEAHGEQHYIEKSNKSNWNNLTEQQNNDKLKKELALSNGIEYYIELDCRNSDLEWVRNSIFNSELSKIFDLSNIDWLQCEEFALTNLVKEVCDYWNTKEEYETTKHLEHKFNLSKTTIINYLKKGNKIGWCKYNPKEELKNVCLKIAGNNKKKVYTYKQDVLVGVFDSCAELVRQSEKLFGVKLSRSSIYLIATGKQKSEYKGYTFKYIEENQNIAC